MLIERGSVHLQDPLSHFFPEFPNGDHITVEQRRRETTYKKLAHFCIHEKKSCDLASRTVGLADVETSDYGESQGIHRVMFNNWRIRMRLAPTMFGLALVSGVGLGLEEIHFF